MSFSANAIASKARSSSNQALAGGTTWNRLTLLGLLLAAVGYWGPWLSHPTVGLTLLGVDLAEVVKFLPHREAALSFPREVFYLPAFALSMALTVVANARSRSHGWFLRTLLTLFAIAVALAILPPIWSPQVLRLPEFRMQTIAIGLLLISAFVGPVIAFLPKRAMQGILCSLALMATLFPIIAFWQLLPALRDAYRTPFHIGWGPWLLIAAWLMVVVTSIHRLRTPIVNMFSK